MTTTTIFIVAMYWFITSIIAIGMTIQKDTKPFDAVCFVLLSFIAGIVIVPMRIGMYINNRINPKH